MNRAAPAGRRQGVARTAIWLAVAAGLAASCTACSEEPEGAYDDFGATLELPGGGTLEVPPSSLLGGTDIDVTIEDAPIPDDVLAFVEPVASFHVELSNPDTLVGPVTVTVPVDVDPATVIALHVEADGSGLEPVPIVAGDGVVTVTASDFSFLWFGSIRDTIEGVAETVWNDLTRDLFADASRPDCIDEEQAREDGWAITSDSGDTVYWCLDLVGGQRIAKVVNNRRYPLILTYGEGVFVKTPPELQLALDDIASRLTAGSRQVILGPGETVEFLLAAGNANARIQTEFDGVGSSIAQLWYGAQLAVSLLSRFGGSSLGTAGDVFAELLDATECIEALRSLDVTAPLSCFNLQTVARLGAGVALAMVGVLTATLLSFLRGQFTALRDVVIDADTYAITITRGTVDPDVQDVPTVMLVVDTSGSMQEVDANGVVKIEGARSSLLDYLGALPVGNNLGLRTYPSSGDDCGSGSLRFPVLTRDPIEMSALIRGLQPAGGTPTAEALLAAADDLRAAGSTDATIVLVSDGESTCADPCAAAKEIEASGIDIQITAVGFQTSEAGTAELRCIADATGGTYINTGNTDDLNDTLLNLTGPVLGLRLEHPDRAVADVGVGPDGLVTIAATVTNDSDRDAEDVTAFLRFDAGQSPGIVSPRRVLGGLGPRATATATWQLRPPPALAGTDIRFSVIASARSAADVTQEGTIAVVDGATRADAGPVFGDGRLAILGDSYSAGEGAGNYLDFGNRTDGCHRSTDTYLVATFELDESEIIACSGAVTADITAPKPTRDVAAQTAQLDRLQATGGPRDAVVMSLGGNDASFAPLALWCLASPLPCDQLIGGVESDVWVNTRITGLTERLVASYGAVDAVLNRSDVVGERGGRAPILVVGYPRIVPADERRTCVSTVTLSIPERVFINDFITRLNGAIEGAVLTAAQAGIPAFYVDTTEEVMQPDHTVCDGERAWARSIDSFRTNLNEDEFASLIDSITNPARRIAGFLGILGTDRFQELLHPNADGYRAMSRAIIRWSLTDAGLAAAELPPAPPQDGDVLRVGKADDVLGSGDDAAGTLQGDEVADVQAGSNYRVLFGGFAPNGPVEISVQSEPFVATVAYADENGEVDALVVLPGNLAAGRHRIIASGAGTEVDAISAVTVINVSADRSLLRWAAIAAAIAVASGALLLVLATAQRRRTTAGDGRLPSAAAPA